MRLGVFIRVALIVVVVLVAMTPIVAYMMDRSSAVSGPQVSKDTIVLQRIVKGLGPAFRDVAVGTTPDRRAILVTGNVPSQEDHDRLRNELRSSGVRTPLSAVKLDVKVVK